MAGSGFNDFITGLAGSAVDLYRAKTARDQAEATSRAQIEEAKKKVALEQAELQRQRLIADRETARQTFNNEQMWKLAGWLVMSGSAALVGAVILKIAKGK